MRLGEQGSHQAGRQAVQIIGAAGPFRCRYLTVDLVLNTEIYDLYTLSLSRRAQRGQLQAEAADMAWLAFPSNPLLIHHA